jgi:hypothetical protein
MEEMDFNRSASPDFLELRRRKVQDIILAREMRYNNDGYQFRHLVIPGINLRSANLWAGSAATSFQSCDLRFADFSHANATRACFPYSNLCFADFESAALERANFSDETKLAGASFRGANVNQAAFRLDLLLLTADFTGAKNIDSLSLYLPAGRGGRLPVLGIAIDPDTGRLCPGPEPSADKIRATGRHVKLREIYDELKLAADHADETIIRPVRAHIARQGALSAQEGFAASEALLRALDKALPAAPVTLAAPPQPQPQLPRPAAPPGRGSVF